MEQRPRLGDLAGRGGAEDPRQGPVELVHDREILFIRAGRPAHGAVGVAHPNQPAQLAERIGVVVDPQIELACPRLAFGRDDEDPARLAAAPVPARGLGGVECVEQPVGQRAFRSLEGFRHRLPDALAVDHVRLRAESIARSEARRRDAGLAYVHGHPTFGVEDRDLAVFGILVRGNEFGECLLGGLPVPQQLEAERAVRELGVRLRGHDAHSGCAPRHHRARVERP